MAKQQRKKRKRQKPKGMTVDVRKGPMSANAAVREIEEVKILAWCPDSQAKAQPEQVHLQIKLKRSQLAQSLRFKSPQTLGFFIEELAEYRRFVWPDCEPVIGEELNDNLDSDETSEP